MKHTATILFLSLISFLLLSSCSPTDADKVAAAQSCLDRSTMANAEECMSLVDGVNSKSADLMRCAAMFTAQGFSDPATVASAMTNLQGGGGASAVSSVMSVFAFTKKSTTLANFDAANSAFNYCNASGSPGLLLLAATAQIATTANYVASALSCGGLNPDMTTALGCLKTSVNGDPNSAQSVAVGNAVLAAYSLNCTGGAQTSPAMCSSFEAAISGSGNNPATVASNFLSNY